MSYEEMKELYQRSAVYQFISLFYALIVMNYLQELMLKYASLAVVLFNVWVLGKTLDEFRAKKRLYIEQEQ